MADRGGAVLGMGRVGRDRGMSQVRWGGAGQRGGERRTGAHVLTRPQLGECGGYI